ncbi:unnamed protein product [Chondrus crispus]|nr:unnamed protein product [Chondrus crispus]CDF41264.1 unnamed protein product [Chondrus crispus]|eukprot:XP_005711558.1 unnamed protein product [Chondrus crispus]
MLSDFRKIWGVFQAWKVGKKTTSPTEVRWLSNEMQCEQGELLSDKKLIATVNELFLIGSGAVLFAVLAGLSVCSFYARRASKWPPVCRALTIDSSRRVMAMSKLSKYNCSGVPTKPPMTLIMRSGENTCHFETTYDDRIDPIGMSDAHKEKLILLGGGRAVNDG